MKKTILTVLIAGFCLPVMGIASSDFVTAPTGTQDQITQTHKSQTTTANSWGLTLTQYQRYLQLMKNTPSQKWYKDLDPAEVLALNAKNPAEMMQYAQIQARNMHARVTRELAFNTLYAKAYQTLYPNQKPIMSEQVRSLQNQAIQSGDRVWLFVGANTPLGQFAYQHLLKIIETTPNTVLDIYFVGKDVTPQTIKAWAENVNLPHDQINKTITLNIGNSRFSSVTKGKNVNLPYIGILHDNRFQPISLSSVL